MQLSDLNPIHKLLIKYLLICMTFGMMLGIIYVSQNTTLNPKSIQNYYQGEDTNDEFIEEHGKSLNELLQTTHNHIISFAFIFIITGFLISITSLKDKLKKFLIVEPFISTLVTFSMMFFIKYIDKNFVYVMIVSSTAMYLTYFISVYLILKNLKK